MKKIYLFSIILLYNALFLSCDDCSDCNSGSMTCKQIIKNSTSHSAKLSLHLKGTLGKEYIINALDSLIIEEKYIESSGGNCQPFALEPDSVVLTFDDTKRLTFYSCRIKTCDYGLNKNILNSKSYNETEVGKNTYQFVFFINDETYKTAK